MNVKKSRARTKIGHLVEMGGVRYSVFLALIVVLPQHVSLNLFCSLSPLECEITRIWAGGLHCAVLAVQGKEEGTRKEIRPRCKVLDES